MSRYSKALQNKIRKFINTGGEVVMVLFDTSINDFIEKKLEPHVIQLAFDQNIILRAKVIEDK